MAFSFFQRSFAEISVMKLHFWSVGREHEAYVKPGVELFTQRLQYYFKCEWVLIPSPRNAAMLSEMDLRKKEAETILDWLEKDDFLVALEERGKMIDSPGLADLLQARANSGCKRLVFLVGGAYGLDESVLKRAGFCWSLSKLVFPHQLVRLILAEQVYRACTILKNEKYHHK